MSPMREKPVDDENRKQNDRQTSDIKIVSNLEQQRQFRLGHLKRFTARRALAGFSSMSWIVLDWRLTVRAGNVFGGRCHDDVWRSSSPDECSREIENDKLLS